MKKLFTESQNPRMAYTDADVCAKKTQHLQVEASTVGRRGDCTAADFMCLLEAWYF